MDRPAASPSAEGLLKFFRRENEVGVIKIKMSASEYAAHHAAYLAAARVPFSTETIYLAHQPVQCGVKNSDTELETRIKSSQGYGKSTLGNDTDVTADGQVTPASSAPE